LHGHPQKGNAKQQKVIEKQVRATASIFVKQTLEIEYIA